MIDKPWWPIPAYRTSQRQTPQLVLVTLPLLLYLDRALGVWEEIALLNPTTHIWDIWLPDV